MFNIGVPILITNLLCVLENMECNLFDLKIACYQAFYNDNH